MESLPALQCKHRIRILQQMGFCASPRIVEVHVIYLPVSFDQPHLSLFSAAHTAWRGRLFPSPCPRLTRGWSSTRTRWRWTFALSSWKKHPISDLKFCVFSHLLLLLFSCFCQISSKENRSGTPVLTDLAAATEPVSSKKSLFEGGEAWNHNVTSVPPSKVGPWSCSGMFWCLLNQLYRFLVLPFDNQDADGLKVGVADLINQWVRGGEHGSQCSSPFKPAVSPSLTLKVQTVLIMGFFFLESEIVPDDALHSVLLLPQFESFSLPLVGATTPQLLFIYCESLVPLLTQQWSNSAPWWPQNNSKGITWLTHPRCSWIKRKSSIWIWNILVLVLVYYSCFLLIA